MTEFEQIYATHFDYVYLFMLKLTRDESLAEEITAQTFFKALSSLNSFAGKCDIRVWLCQIAKNYYMSYLRKNKKLADIADFEALQADEGHNVEQIILNSDEAVRLHTIIHELAAPYKEVFTLRVFAELSFKQIATLFGKTDNWACVTYHRARARILKELEEKK